MTLTPGITLSKLSFSGTPAAVNLTESLYLHEAESMIREEENVENEKSRVASEALAAMESTPPLHELLVPLFEQVNRGLAGMGKIVGGRTLPKDINPATLATVISVKERCEKEIILPMQEMDQLAASRLKELKEMYKSQLQQMAALKETTQLLRDWMKVTSEKMEVAESNAALLAQRSSAIYQACQDLRPTVTTKEREYFDLLRRVKVKCDKWEESIGAVLNESSKLCEAIDAGQAKTSVDLTEEDDKHCRALQRGMELSLKTSRKSVDRAKSIVNTVCSATGLGVGDENISPPDSSGQQ